MSNDVSRLAIRPFRKDRRPSASELNKIAKAVGTLVSNSPDWIKVQHRENGDGIEITFNADNLDPVAPLPFTGRFEDGRRYSDGTFTVTGGQIDIYCGSLTLPDQNFTTTPGGGTGGSWIYVEIIHDWATPAASASLQMATARPAYAGNDYTYIVLGRLVEDSEDYGYYSWHPHYAGGDIYIENGLTRSIDTKKGTATFHRGDLVNYACNACETCETCDTTCETACDTCEVECPSDCTCEGCDPECTCDGTCDGCDTDCPTDGCPCDLCEPECTCDGTCDGCNTGCEVCETAYETCTGGCEVGDICPSDGCTCEGCDPECTCDGTCDGCDTDCPTDGCPCDLCEPECTCDMACDMECPCDMACDMECPCDMACDMECPCDMACDMECTCEAICQTCDTDVCPCDVTCDMDCSLDGCPVGECGACDGACDAAAECGVECPCDGFDAECPCDGMCDMCECDACNAGCDTEA